MVNFLKWGIVAAIAGAVLIFRKPIGDFITSGAKGVGGFVGEAIGGGIGSLPSGVIKGFSEGINPLVKDWGTPEGRRNLPDWFPSLWGENQKGIDPNSDRDNPSDPTITPYNREQVARLEQSVSKQAGGTFGLQANRTANIFVKSGAPTIQAERQAKTFMTAFNNQTGGGHAQRVREAQQVSGTTMSPLALFRVYQAQGLSNTESMRLVRERIG